MSYKIVFSPIIVKINYQIKGNWFLLLFKINKKIPGNRHELYKSRKKIAIEATSNEYYSK